MKIGPGAGRQPVRTGGTAAVTDPVEIARRQAVMRHWAPVIFQQTDRYGPRQDYITRVDFDGDFRSNNNWEHFRRLRADFRPAIYSDVVETDTHYFLHFYDFHPRDWDRPNIEIPGTNTSTSHENDLEGATVVVEKDGSAFGKLAMVISQAHGKMHIFTEDARFARGSNEHFHCTQLARVDGHRPALYIEARGHGVYALSKEDFEAAQTTQGEFPETSFAEKKKEKEKEVKVRTGVVYRPGLEARAPRNKDDRDCPYELRSFYDTFWPLRADIGTDRFLDQPMEYQGLKLGSALDGDDYADDAAKPPWAWSDGGSKRGDFFFRPAETLKRWVKLPADMPFSTNYRHNPYLKALDEK